MLPDFHRKLQIWFNILKTERMGKDHWSAGMNAYSCNWTCKQKVFYII